MKEWMNDSRTDKLAVLHCRGLLTAFSALRQSDHLDRLVHDLEANRADKASIRLLLFFSQKNIIMLNFFRFSGPRSIDIVAKNKTKTIS